MTAATTGRASQDAGVRHGRSPARTHRSATQSAHVWRVAHYLPRPMRPLYPHLLATLLVAAFIVIVHAVDVAYDVAATTISSVAS